MTRILRSKWKDFIDELFTFKWIIFGMIIYIYGSRSKEQIYYFSVQTKLSLNKWDLLHSFLSDIYLILYFILPVLLYRSISIIMSDFEYTILIRLGSYRSWVYQTLNKFVQSLSIATMVWGAVSGLLLIGAPSFAGWSPFSKLDDSLSETQILQKFIDTPFLALLLHLSLLILSLICIHLILAIIYVKSQRKGIVIFIAVFIWVYSGVSFKLLPSHAYLFNLCNYLILHSGAAQFGNIWGPFAIVIGLATLVVWSVNRIDLNTKIFSKLRYNWGYIIFFALIVIALWSGMREKLGKTIWDQFIFMFIGGSNQTFSLKSFLSYWVIYFGFIYLIQLYLQRELSEIGYYKLLRYRSISKWFWEWYRKIMIYIAFYLLILALFSLLLSSLKRFSFDFYISVDNSITIFEVFYHFFVNGYLQVLFYVLFVFIISWLSKEIFYSLLAICILSIFMFPGLNNWLIIPSGLNSIGYILSDHSIYRISVVLFLWNILGMIFVLYIFHKKDIDL
ncbi:permease [Parageobacillus thermoglucosidasius]|uniref:permease n=1 Tax=Parageobacillus thermoglucosidasius TaxID=1426 RepID=UPI00241FF2BB|nr:permease [Parageobacillus thermoglucosidasius]